METAQMILQILAGFMVIGGAMYLFISLAHAHRRIKWLERHHNDLQAREVVVPEYGTGYALIRRGAESMQLHDMDSWHGEKETIYFRKGQRPDANYAEKSRATATADNPEGVRFFKNTTKEVKQK